MGIIIHYDRIWVICLMTRLRSNWPEGKLPSVVVILPHQTRDLNNEKLAHDFIIFVYYGLTELPMREFVDKYINIEM